MGRSFDRGGQSRKERERGKRRAYRHAVRDREAREAAAQAKRTGTQSFARKHKAPRIVAAAARPIVPTPVVSTNVAQATVVQAHLAPREAARPRAERSAPGFFAQVINRFFKKAA